MKIMRALGIVAFSLFLEIATPLTAHAGTETGGSWGFPAPKWTTKHVL
jgi:hypothetical protein